jgi:hypothetical protein
MKTRSLKKSQWKSLTEWVSKALSGTRAEIEVSGLGIGSQIQAEWMPLLGLVYDAKTNVFEVVLEGVDHLIRAPRELNLLEESFGLESIEIVDAEGRWHTVTFKDPLALPALEPE